MGGISPLIDSARAPKETPQSLVKIPAPKKFGPDDVGTMQAQVRSKQTRLDKYYAEQERLLGETGNLTTQLAQYAANLVSYRNEQEVFKANQQKEAAKADSEIITKMLGEIRGSPLYKQKQETNKQIAEYSAFVPTEVTAPMLGVLFATIGATGMLLGGNSKNTAKAALSAMNGMAEGFGKGREQYDKERKQAFDSNVKLLQTKLSAINDGLEEARKEAILNKQAAELKVRETLAANEAQFLQENTNRRGLESTIELVKGQLASLNKSLELQKTKTNQIEGQLQRQSDNLDLKQLAIQSAQAMQQDRIAAQIAADERRARERQEDIRLTASLRQPPAPRVGIQDGQMVQLPDPRTLPTANVTAPISSVTAGAKKVGEVKPPPKEILTRVEARDSLIPSLKELLPTLDRLNNEGKYNELSLALNSPTGAEWYFKDDLDAIKAIRILAKFRGGEFETAGKSLTKREDEILRPLYQAANRPYVAVRNAVQEGLKELTQQNEGYKNAYPEFYKRQAVSGDGLSQRMDQAGAAPGTSVADVRAKAQEKILEINARIDINQLQKQELVGKIGSLYKQKTGMDL
jgi:hypothetical protein